MKSANQPRGLVSVMCLPTAGNTTERVVLLVVMGLVAASAWSFFYAILPVCIPAAQALLCVLWLPPLAAMLVSYFRCRWTSPGIVPAGWVARGVKRVERKRDGRLRFCKHCRADKPDRSHHCTWCGACILKLDHTAVG